MTATHTTTNSERTSWSCRRKWFFRHLLRLRPILTARPLRVGGLWHHAMEALYGVPGQGVDLDRAKKAIVEQTTANIAMLRGDTSFDPSSDYRLTPEDVQQDAALVGAMLAGYWEKWQTELAGTVVLLNEEALYRNTVTPQGTISPVSLFGGKVDKVIRDSHGQNWLVEHKSSKVALDAWRPRNDYKPQAPTYAWLLQNHPALEGRDVVGVLYDLALTRVPPKPEDLTVLKKGDRLSKVLPSGTTLQVFEAALRMHGFALTDEEWYQERAIELGALEDPFFRRELYRFAEGEAEVGRELWTIATDIRRAHHDAEDVVAKLDASRNTVGWKEEVEIVKVNDYRFPRSPDSCWAFNRPCDYMALCRYRDCGSLVDLEVVDEINPELDLTVNHDKE